MNLISSIDSANIERAQESASANAKATVGWTTVAILVAGLAVVAALGARGIGPFSEFSVATDASLAAAFSATTIASLVMAVKSFRQYQAAAPQRSDNQPSVRFLREKLSDIREDGSFEWHGKGYEAVWVAAAMHLPEGDAQQLGLSKWQTITRLDLSGLDLSDFGNSDFACEKDGGLIDELVRSPQLRSLNLSHCGPAIGMIGAVRLARESRSLIDLNLSYCFVENVGARALATNPRLETLDLRGNMIGPVGARAFRENRVLTQLDLSENGLSEDVVRQVQRDIVENRQG